MSLLRKLRRRHKAFVLKRSSQVHGDGAAWLCPVGDGGEEDENGDGDLIVDSFQQADRRNVDLPVPAPGHEIEIKPICMEHFSVQRNVPAQSPISMPVDSATVVNHGMQVAGRESRFWPGIAKTIGFLMVTALGFSIGKLAAVGLTLTLAFFGKLLSRHDICSCEGFISGETGHGHGSHESLSSNAEGARSDRGILSTVESDGLSGMVTGPVYMNADGHSLSTIEPHEEALSVKLNEDSLLNQRKKLKRLNCLKIPPPASPFDVEAMEESPPSSSKATPQTWFRNAGNSTPTTVAGSPETNKHGKFRSRVLLRHLRKKGEPQSAPCSPSSTDQIGDNRAFVASDGSDMERSGHLRATVNKKSKFRPAPVTDGSMALPNEHTPRISAARKEERTVFPASLQATEVMAVAQEQGMEKSAEREEIVADVHIPPSQAVGNMPSSLRPATNTSRDSTMKLDLPSSPFSSTHELQRRRRGKNQSSRRPVNVPLQEILHTNFHTVVGGEKRRNRVRVGTPWVAVGVVITIAGLFLGRVVAVTGLVCYWYALSLGHKTWSGRRR